MIYSLFNHFNDVLGARLFTYISFRAILAGVIALLVSVFFGDYFINLLKRRNISETQRDEKLDPFNVAKKGVPTMGGIVIIASMLIAVLLLGNLTNIYMILMLATTLILGTLGFADDYIKTFRHNKDGLNGWIKIAGQVLLGLIIGLTCRMDFLCLAHYLCCSSGQQWCQSQRWYGWYVCRQLCNYWHSSDCSCLR